MNAIRRLGVHERNANAFQEAKRDKPLFSITKPIVLECESRASKDFFGIGKIKTVVLEIGSSLGFAPRKLHCGSVYTLRIFVKGGGGKGRIYCHDKECRSGRAGSPASRATAGVATGVKTSINLPPETIRDSLQAEALTKEVPINQVFDFSYLPAR